MRAQPLRCVPPLLSVAPCYRAIVLSCTVLDMGMYVYVGGSLLLFRPHDPGGGEILQLELASSGHALSYGVM